MKTVKMYEIGEEVVIKAKIVDMEIIDGEIKYRLKVDSENNDMSHLFKDGEIIGPFDKTVEKNTTPLIERKASKGGR